MVLNQFNENSSGLSNPFPAGILTLPGPFSAVYSLKDINYDWAIGGIPFLAGETLRGTYFRRQYLREYAAIRKDQFDAQNVPGEQSFLGFWLRSQNTFSQGAGIQYLDPSIDQAQELRYSYSEGLDVMGTAGQVSLLQATKTIRTGLTGPVQLRGVQKGGVDGVLCLDTAAATFTFLNAAGGSTPYTMPGGLTGLANTLTDDGVNYYFADKTGIYSGLISSSSAATKLWDVPSTSGNYVLAWVKGRLMAALDNNVYELVGGTPPTLPTPRFTHPNASYTFSAISEIPAAIIVSGSAGGTQSQIHKFTLDTTTGALPVMSSGVVTASMPIGEVITAMYSYIATFVGIGTNKGFRVATVDTNGNLVYGPLNVQDPTSVGVKAVGGYDRFLFIGNQGNKLVPQPGWVNPTEASAVDMLMRVDLSQTSITGQNPFANDLMTTGTDGVINSIVNFGTSVASTGMLAFATQTKVWITDTANKQANGFLYTGKIRYNTLEPKHFKYVSLRAQNIQDGSIDISAQNRQMILTSLLPNITGLPDPNQPVYIPDIGNAQEWLQLKFTLHRGTVNTNVSPVWNGYQLRSLPGVNRQLLLTLPLIVTDIERDNVGNPVGYRGDAGHNGFAKDRLFALEAILQGGNITTVQDLQSNITYLAFMEEYHYEQQANPQKGESVGGYVLVQLRVVQSGP